MEIGVWQSILLPVAALVAARQSLHGYMVYAPTDRWLFKAFWQALTHPDRTRRQAAQGSALAYALAGMVVLLPIIYGA